MRLSQPCHVEVGDPKSGLSLSAGRRGEERRDKERLHVVRGGGRGSLLWNK